MQLVEACDVSCGAILASSSATAYVPLVCHALPSLLRYFIVVSEVAAALAVVVAPIQKLWPLRRAQGTPAAERGLLHLGNKPLATDQSAILTNEQRTRGIEII